MTFDRSQILIVRAWLEPHPTAPLRATVKWTTDGSADFERTVRLADVDAIAGVVTTWLRSIEARSHP